MQFQSDLFEFKVTRPKMLETTALSGIFSRISRRVLGQRDELQEHNGQTESLIQKCPEMKPIN
jgi:glycerol kinase